MEIEDQKALVPVSWQEGWEPYAGLQGAAHQGRVESSQLRETAKEAKVRHEAR